MPNAQCWISKMKNIMLESYSLNVNLCNVALNTESKPASNFGMELRTLPLKGIKACSKIELDWRII